MKRFDGGSLIPGATWHATADSDAEIVRQVVRRLKAEHGETEVRPDMIERIKERIFEVQTRH